MDIGVFFFGIYLISILVLLLVSNLFLRIYSFFISLIVSLLFGIRVFLPRLPLNFYFYLSSLLLA